MWEFYGIMTATNQAGLSNQFLEDEGGNIDPRETEASKSNSKLQKVHDEYMERFKFFSSLVSSALIFFCFPPNFLWVASSKVVVVGEVVGVS